MESYSFQTKTFSQRFFGHLKTVCIHKYYVAQGCFRCGLYWQGIFHDTSKFSPVEFFTGVKYYDGHKSPNAVEKRVNDGCSKSWLHHKGRNKHHFEYWIDYGIRKGSPSYGNRMPMKYLAEMVCDRRAACIAYQGLGNYDPGSPWDHYQITKNYSIMHEDTRAVLEKCLILMRDEGEDACFAYIRQLLKKTHGQDYSYETLGISRSDVDVIG